MANLNCKNINNIIRIPHKELKNLSKYYQINSKKELENFWRLYFNLAENLLNQFGYSLKDKNFILDHLALSVRNHEEFKYCTKQIIKIANVVSVSKIKNQNCNIYYFKNTPIINKVKLLGIEIVESSPKINQRKLKPGIEHLAICVKDYKKFIKEWKKKKLPIAYEKIIDGSAFFKTPFMNGMQFEFRENLLVKNN